MNSRRDFLQSSVAAAALTGAAACSPDSQSSSPKPASDVGAVPASNQSTGPLTSLQAMTLATLGNTMVPGASDAGLVNYVQSQLGGALSDSLLMLNYLDVPHEDHLGFYQAALDAADTASNARHDKAFHLLDEGSAMELIGQMFGDAIENWQGPPSSFALFALRADAIDVVYGTKAGIERIGMPHMAHIEPVEEW